MAYGYWKTGRSEDPAVFEVFFRKNPFQGSYTIFCGIDEVIKFLAHFRFTEDDIEYLQNRVPSLADCEPEFFDYLSTLDCSQVTVQSVEQGSVVFPRTPLLIVSGPLLVVQLVETTILNLVNFPSLVSTNASRMVIAARGQFSNVRIYGKVPKLLEFGLRRAQGPDGGFSASKYCMVGGFDAVANVQAGKLLNVPISGTHAHSFVMSYSSLADVATLQVKDKTAHGDKMVTLLDLVLKYRKDSEWTDTNDGELAAFVAYGVSFPSSFLCLVDTYNTLKSGICNFILVSLALMDCGYEPRGIRLDSGDLAALSMQCRQIFQEAADKYDRDSFTKMNIVASDGINEKILHDLNKAGHGINLFGIGTNLVTCQAQPALGCVFKLVELNGKPRIKLSNNIEKVLIPGRKKLFRLFGNDGFPILDLLVEVNEKNPLAGKQIECFDPFSKEKKICIPSRVEDRLSTVWDKNGAFPIPDLMEARERCNAEVQKLNPDMLRIEDPLKYDVFVSKKLYNNFQELWASTRI